MILPEKRVCAACGTTLTRNGCRRCGQPWCIGCDQEGRLHDAGGGLLNRAFCDGETITREARA